MGSLWAVGPDAHIKLARMELALLGVLLGFPASENIVENGKNSPPYLHKNVILTPAPNWSNLKPAPIPTPISESESPILVVIYEARCPGNQRN